MNYNTYTAQAIFDLHPCGWDKEDGGYTLNRITELWAGRPAITLLEILDLDISEEDRIWAVTRCLPEVENRVFAAWCMRESTKKMPEPLPEILAACDTADRYALGEVTTADPTVAIDRAWARAWTWAGARAWAWAGAEAQARAAAAAAAGAEAWAEARAPAPAWAEAQVRAGVRQRQLEYLRARLALSNEEVSNEL